MTDRELMQQALDELEHCRVFVTTREKLKHPEGTELYDEVIEALRARLAEPEPVVNKKLTTEPEPVACEPVGYRHWIEVDGERFPQLTLVPRTDFDDPLYAALPQRTPDLSEVKRIATQLGWKPPVAHTDHPARHWDRTCPACNEPEPVAWTAVTTRLPQYDDDRRILCYCAEHDYGGTQFITLKASDFWAYDPDGDGEPGTPDSRTVTHWMLEDDAIAWVTNTAPPQREEPVAWMYPSDLKRFQRDETTATAFSVQVGSPDELSAPLYTAPPQREWVGLTDEEIRAEWLKVIDPNGGDEITALARAIEAKLKEKNA